MKNPLKSKTLWVNMLVLVAGVLGYMQGHDVIAEYPQIVAVMAAAVGALNIALRFVTSKPIV